MTEIDPNSTSSLWLPAMANEADRVAKEIAPVLRAEGFRKKGRSWHRATDDVIQVINLQGSQWSTEEFYCNLALYIKALGDLETPPEYTCHIRRRVDTDDLGAMISSALDWFAGRATESELGQKLADGVLQAVATGEAQSYLRR
jgi:hypothetical protein